MKRNVITIGVALAIVAGIVAINRFDPSRRTDDQIEASEQTGEQLAQAAQNEQDNAEAAASEDALTAADVKDDNVIQLKFECSNGDFTLEIYREWAPLGVEQFLKAVDEGVYNGARFFRVVPDFIVQFGIPGDPQLAAKWRNSTIQDDPVLKPNVRGTICFAARGPHTRTTQLYINFSSSEINRNLDGMGFAPFGKVIEGMETVDNIESKHGEAPSQAQELIMRKGNDYLNASFPGLDYIKKVTIIGSRDAE